MTSERYAAQGRRFAVATPHEAATQAAVQVFETGGTAVDAAVAANAVLAVVYPHMCGIGGDLFAIVTDSRTSTVVNGSGRAAMAMEPESIRREYGSMPAHGPCTVTVPGTIAAWAELVRDFGRLPLGAAIMPAIIHAETGLPVSKSLAQAIDSHRARIAADPGLRMVMMPAGRPLRERDILHQPALGATLRSIVDKGPEAFYAGSVGSRFIAGLRARGSPLTLDDLKGHETEVVRPLKRQYRDLEILVPPPNSQGFMLEEIMGCIEQGGVEPDHLGRDAAVIAQVFMLASRDRDRFLADGEDLSAPSDGLLSDHHIRDLLDQANAASAGRAAGGLGSGDTVGIVAVDQGGLWVSINQSLYDAFGSGILEPETGIIAHNRGSGFSLEPESPNVLKGGKRPAHTLMPVIVVKQGLPVIASATMGGKAHAQIHAELLMALIDQRRGAFDAINLPRWLAGGVQGDDASRVFAESRVADSVTADMARAGMRLEILADWDEKVGHAQLVVRDDDGQLHAASDPRADGAAACG